MNTDPAKNSSDTLKSISVATDRARTSLKKLDWSLWWDLHRPIWFYRFSRWWHEQIVCRINPRNKWASDVIGRIWNDKPELIRDFLFAAIVHYVEGEKCFETVGWDWCEGRAEIGAKIREIYAWAKTGREEADKAANALWYPGEIDAEGISGDLIVSGTDRGSFTEYCAATDAIEKKDAEYLAWIVQYRDYLWT